MEGGGRGGRGGGSMEEHGVADINNKVRVDGGVLGGGGLILTTH